MTSNEERGRILRMVSEGQLAPEEAANLLEALDAATRPTAQEVEWGPGVSAMPMPPVPPVPAMASSASLGSRGRAGGRAVVIHVKEGGENRVNIRIPLALAKVAGKFIPRQAAQYLAAYEIDLQQFLEGVSDAEGVTLLEVREGENKVLIAVE